MQESRGVLAGIALDWDMEHTWIAPAATMTSRLAVAVYRVEPPLSGANSTPDAMSGILVLAQLIFVTWRGTGINQMISLIQNRESDEQDEW